MTHCHTCLDTLRKLGHRITPQREMIIEVLSHGDDHNTAEEIYQRLQNRTHAINLATVYRTLDLLVTHGLANRTYSLDGKIIYATMQHGPHVHLSCRQCGKVIKADHNSLLPFSVILKDQYKFSADLQHTIIFGFCHECQASSTNQNKRR